MSTENRLQNVYQQAKVISFDSRSRFVIASDCHRGVGNWGDNFLPNQNLFFAALDYYYQRGFTYIELGDGDELWENRSMQQIIQIHSNAFWLMSKYYRENRLFMLAGNHDMVKRDSKFLDTTCKQYFCESSHKQADLFPNLKTWDGIILKHCNQKDELFLTHGHQGDFLNDRAWRLGRFMVRYLWRPLEMLGVNDPTSAAKNYDKKNKIEKKLSQWANDSGKLLITGHTHRPFFSQPGDGLYFNDGSCVHPRCMTNLEIENDSISLVKWSVSTRTDSTMYVGREVLEGPVKIRNYRMDEDNRPDIRYYES